MNFSLKYCSGCVSVSGRNVPEIQWESCRKGGICRWKLWLWLHTGGYGSTVHQRQAERWLEYFYGGKMQIMLSSGFLKQQWSCGNSFSVSFCLPLRGDQFRPNVVGRNWVSHWMGHWIGEELWSRCSLRAPCDEPSCSEQAANNTEVVGSTPRGPFTRWDAHGSPPAQNIRWLWEDRMFSCEQQAAQPMCGCP